MKRFERILACTDFSEVGNRAVEMAFGLAHDDNATVVVAHVLDQPAVPNPMYAHYVSHGGWEPEEFEKARDETDKALLALVPDGAAPLGVTTVTLIPQGNPAEEILRLAKEEKSEVVVMGTHGRTGLERFLLGSVTERVVRMASCAVMVIH
jgi:universal stress protein A